VRELERVEVGAAIGVGVAGAPAGGLQIEEEVALAQQAPQPLVGEAEQVAAEEGGGVDAGQDGGVAGGGLRPAGHAERGVGGPGHAAARERRPGAVGELREQVVGAGQRVHPRVARSAAHAVHEDEEDHRTS
jgi:hypothetical protein